MFRFRQTVNIVFVCLILLLGFEPFMIASPLQSLLKEKALRKTNFHSISLELYGKSIKISGMSHPGLWGEESSGVLKEQEVTHLLSLESKFNRQLRPLLQGIKHKTLDVPDMTAPSLKQLKDVLLWIEKSLEQNPHMHLGVHCWGGNGRTGTVLAFLKLLASPETRAKSANDKLQGVNVYASVKNAVQVVRSINKHAVEVPSQLQMLNLVEENRVFFNVFGQRSSQRMITDEQIDILSRAAVASALRHSAVLMNRTVHTEGFVATQWFPLNFSNSLYKKSLKSSGKRASDYASALIRSHLPTDVAISVIEDLPNQSAHKAIDFVLENYPDIPNVIEKALSADPGSVEELKLLASSSKFKPFQKIKSFVPGFFR
ncbi:MAG: hypothetical protein AB8C84_04845 [Oligoflexales bacterium]